MKCLFLMILFSSVNLLAQSHDYEIPLNSFVDQAFNCGAGVKIQFELEDDIIVISGNSRKSIKLNKYKIEELFNSVSFPEQYTNGRGTNFVDYEFDGVSGWMKFFRDDITGAIEISRFYFENSAFFKTKFRCINIFSSFKL